MRTPEGQASTAMQNNEKQTQKQRTYALHNNLKRGGIE